MASHPNARRKSRPSKKPDQAKRPQGVEKGRPRRSARLQGISAHSSAGKVPKGRKAPQREREQEPGHSSPQDQDRPPSKRSRTSPPSYSAEGESKAKTESETSKRNPGPVEGWIQTGRWPSQYFEHDSQAGEDFFQHDTWLEEQMERSLTPVVTYVEINGRSYPRPLRRVPNPLRPKWTNSSLAGVSTQLPREADSAQYSTARYSVLLATKGSFMKQSDSGITTSSEKICHSLLQTEQTVPQDSLFRDDLFKKTCRNLQDRNEAMVVRDITLLIVPSAQTLAMYGATHLNHLFECVNQGWNAAIPVQGVRPQPDYSVGFGRSAFTEQQLKRLGSLLGDMLYDSQCTSYFAATYQMYFPFFTCEVKCATAMLDVADRQNAHSMTIAVRGVVELYRAVQREKELHQEILAFSISHNHSIVRIYGHYALIDGKKTTFYRHPIREFSLTDLDGREKWTAYKFTKSVYDVWMPTHLKRICSAIDQLPPELHFNSLQRPDTTSGLSHELGGLVSGKSNVGSLLRTSQDNSGKGEDNSGKGKAVLKRPGEDDSGNGEVVFKRVKRKHPAE